jgi:K+-transporting ATPase ATPase C chain
MKTLYRSIRIFFFFTILTGLLYPLLVTEIAQALFPYKANGSMIVRNNEIVGSALIGQKFYSEKYFMSRPSASDYNALSSGGSNHALNSKDLKFSVEARKRTFLVFNNLSNNISVPPDMLFASASGLDPHISYKSALLQADRVARARNYNSMQKLRLLQLINKQREKPQFLILGEDRVNVFLLNLKVDAIK